VFGGMHGRANYSAYSNETENREEEASVPQSLLAAYPQLTKELPQAQGQGPSSDRVTASVTGSHRDICILLTHGLLGDIQHPNYNT
jgi:hypothetical protein